QRGGGELAPAAHREPVGQEDVEATARDTPGGLFGAPLVLVEGGPVGGVEPVDIGARVLGVAEQQVLDQVRVFQRCAAAVSVSKTTWASSCISRSMTTRRRCSRIVCTSVSRRSRGSGDSASQASISFRKYATASVSRPWPDPPCITVLNSARSAFVGQTL